MVKLLKLIFAAATVPLLTILFASPVLAHVYGSDGPINITLHIEPDDDPIIGSPATLFYTIADKESKFETSKCICQVTISESGTAVFHQTISSTSDNETEASPSASMQMGGNNSFQVTYTFPKADVYTVLLTATPTTPNAFHAFTSSFDFRITRQLPNQTTASASAQTVDWTPILEGGAILLLFLIPVVMVLVKFLGSRLARYPSPPVQITTQIPQPPPAQQPH